MNVVVSGASRGIGLRLVGEYLSAGDAVFAVCRDPASADGLRALRGTDDLLTVLPGDVSDPGSVAGIKAAIGDRPVDVLLNVAGLLLMEKAPEDIDPEAWARSFDVMVTGPVRMTLALLPNLQAARGKVVSITSQIGASDWTQGGLYAYGAAKAALNRAMKSLAVDLKPRGISVALVHPGYVKTDMTGHNGEIAPEDSARGIKAVADRLDLASTGSFSNWNGSPHAW